MVRHSPISTRTDSLFPYPPLFRSLDSFIDHDKGHGRVEERSVAVSRETDWLTGTRRFPGELRLPGAATIVRVPSRTELRDRCRFDTRYYISPAPLSAQDRKDVVSGTSVSVRVELGGHPIIQKKKN